MKLTTALTILLLCHTAVYCADKPSAETWRYPANGPSSEGQVSLGRAGNLTTFRLSTEDSVEKVVSWYGKRLGLGKDHSLMEAAATGFGSTKKDIDGSWIVYHDTDEQQTAGVVLASISAQQAHVAISYRPSFTSQKTISISISGVANRTSIIVTEPTDE